MSIPIIDYMYDDNHRRKMNSIFRKTSTYNNEQSIDLSTNSYLNLQNNQQISDAAQRLCNGHLSGNTASRLISQSTPLYDDLESELATWKNCESSLLFPTGYAANTGIIPAICGRRSEIFSDRLNHASIINGCLLSGAKLARYRHNDMAHLEELLRASQSPHRLIVTDTVFSMDGDRAKLADICELGERYGCAVMVDEAHATGIFGTRASGLVEAAGVEGAVHIRVGTLSKAVAGLGGFFAGDAQIRDYLVNNAPPLIYSTGLPHAVLAYGLAAVRYIRGNPYMGKMLIDKADKLRKMLIDMGWDCMGSDTQIIPVVTGSAERAIEMSAYLKKGGIKAPAIRTPTVPLGKERVRLSVHLGVGDDELGVIGRVMREYRHQVEGK